MSSRGRRVWIGVIAAAAVALFAFMMLLWLAFALGCEDADDAAFDTVACDSERGRGWVTVQLVMAAAGALALLGGTVFAFKRARLLPVVIPAVAIVPLFLGIFAINDIELENKPVPQVTEVRVLSTSCAVPCRDGFPVSVTVDQPAEYDDIGGRQYKSGVEGDSDGVEVDAGTHELRVTGEIVNPPDEAGPLPPGEYEVEVVARPQDAGSQSEQSSRPVVRRVTITEP